MTDIRSQTFLEKIPVQIYDQPIVCFQIPTKISIVHCNDSSSQWEIQLIKINDGLWVITCCSYNF